MTYALGTASWSAGTSFPATSVVESRTLNVSVDVGGLGAFTIRCKVTDPSSYTAGTISLFAGGDITGLHEQFTYGPTIINTMVAAGWRVVQLAFSSSAWVGTVGPLVLAGRGATALRALYDRADLHTVGLPFVVSGNSGGSSLIAYALAHYGCGDFIDHAVMTSGPPHGRLDLGSMGSRNPAWAALAPSYANASSLLGYTSGATSGWTVDKSYSGTAAAGAVSVNAGMGGPSNVYFRDSVAGAGAAFSYPQTACTFLYGSLDLSEAVPLGWGGYARLVSSALTTITTLVGANHALPDSTAGRDGVLAALQAAVYRHG